MTEFERLDAQARRIGCVLVTNAALDEFTRQARETRKLEREIEKLRKEVSILHFRMKSPYGRMVTRWKLRQLRRAS